MKHAERTPSQRRDRTGISPVSLDRPRGGYCSTMDGRGVERLGAAHIEVLDSLVRTYKGSPAPQRALEGWLADPRRTVLAAFEDGRAVGWAYGYELTRIDGRPPMFVLYEIEVDAAHRRRGHGRALVTAVLDDARRRGCGEMWVLTGGRNTAAMRLYASCGGVRENRDDVMFTFQL
jgi:GNAT superfamily N-acetyltransferase